MVLVLRSDKDIDPRLAKYPPSMTFLAYIRLNGLSRPYFEPTRARNRRSPCIFHVA